MATPDDGPGGERASANAHDDSRRQIVLILLAAAVCASGALLLIWGSRLTFLLDDWRFLLYRPGFSAESILTPHGEHIVVGPVLVYKALLELVGMDSALPFRVVSVGAFLISAVLLFVYLRRRVDEWLALAATLIVLFLGPAWEDLLWPFQIGFFTAMACGLGALLCLEREDRRGAAWACALLSVAIVFSSLGIPFIVGCAVLILLGGQGWRRIWVVLVPAAIYAIWWLGWGHDAETAVSLANLARTPVFVLNSAAAGAASLFGLVTPGQTVPTVGGLEWGRPLLVALAVGAAFWLHRRGRAPAWLWVALALAGSFWFFAGLNAKEGRSPTASRYQYVSVIFLLLILAELVRDWRIGPRLLPVLVVATGAILIGNIAYLHQAYESYRTTSELERGALGSLDIIQDTVSPGFVPSEDLSGTGYVNVEEGAFRDAAEEYGSPGYSEEELAGASQEVRFNADKVQYFGLAAEFVPLPPGTRVERPAAVTEPGPDGVVAPRDGCVKVAPREGRAVVALPPGGALIAAGEAPIDNVKFRRFADEGTFPIDSRTSLAAGRAAEARIAADRSAVPWKVLVKTAAPATICGL